MTTEQNPGNKMEHRSTVVSFKQAALIFFF